MMNTLSIFLTDWEEVRYGRFGLPGRVDNISGLDDQGGKDETGGPWAVYEPVSFRPSLQGFFLFVRVLGGFYSNSPMYSP